MLEIEVNPIVLETINQCFPKPRNSAQKALDKYIQLLTQQLTKSILLGRNVWMQSNDLYFASLRRNSVNACKSRDQFALGYPQLFCNVTVAHLFICTKGLK